MSGERAERRLHPRVPLTSTVLVQANELEILTTTKDLGLGGVRFLHMSPLGEGTPVSLHIRLDGGLVRAEGCVVSESRRGDDVYELGIRFLSIDATERRALQRFFSVDGGRS